MQQSKLNPAEKSESNKMTTTFSLLLRVLPPSSNIKIETLDPRSPRHTIPEGDSKNDFLVSNNPDPRSPKHSIFDRCPPNDFLTLEQLRQTNEKIAPGEVKSDMNVKLEKKL